MQVSMICPSKKQNEGYRHYTHQSKNMAKNFAAIAFSPEVKVMQEKLGSRASYARMEKDTYIDGLTENEIDFIAQRDSFYMASNGENGFPYIQHRGGPK